jgi:antirestriction protein ArdC
VRDLPEDLANVPAPIPDLLILPQAEALIASTGAHFRIDGDHGFYSPAQDFQVPPPEAFFEPINWHRTALHQLGPAIRPDSHAICLAPSAPNPMVRKNSAPKWRAPLCLARHRADRAAHRVPRRRARLMLTSRLLEVLREDNRAVVRAASQASKAADWILGFLPAEVKAELSEDGRAA